jgi:hypothetical protein
MAPRAVCFSGLRWPTGNRTERKLTQPEGDQFPSFNQQLEVNASGAGEGGE